MTQTHDAQCNTFRDQLDAWLAGDYDAAHMQEHHDSCASCRAEARLARAIGAITTTLPQVGAPAIDVTFANGRTRPHTAAPGATLFARLLQAWRQPLVCVPAFALVAVLFAVLQSRTPGTALEPALVIIDGEEYSRAEIRKAAEDLQLALRYIERYRPARVISAELDTYETPAAAEDSRAHASPTI